MIHAAACGRCDTSIICTSPLNICSFQSTQRFSALRQLIKAVKFSNVFTPYSVSIHAAVCGRCDNSTPTQSLTLVAFQSTQRFLGAATEQQILWLFAI
jgi:hypothetical protein